MNAVEDKSQESPPLRIARAAHPHLTEAGGAQREAVGAANLVPEHLLDGGEIVILAIKPSLWFIVFASARWLIFMSLIIIAAGWLGRHLPHINTPTIVQAALALAAARVAFAILQWVSRLYILTNRRIMRLTGILNIDLFECPLTKIQNTYLTLTWYERLTRLGTISFATAGTGGVEASWTNVNNPLELHERLRSAIHRAQKFQNEL
jgi:uncharacterized membrane protein YdbT with pleckstrin-like domain